MESHADVVRWGFGSWILLMCALVHHKLQRTHERGLHGSDIHFTVALPGVTIPNLKQGAARVHRHVKRAPRHQFFVIHVARVDVRRGAVNSPVSFGRRYSHTSEEWVQRNLDSWSELRHHALVV